MPKRGLLAEPASRALQRKVLATSRVSWPIIRVVRILAPVYASLILKFRKIEIWHPEQIIREFQDFQTGKTRLIVAFRHAYGDEPQLMFHAIDNLLPREAKKLGIKFARATHLRLIHDYAVPLWGDAITRLIIPLVGAVPIYHVKVDPESLKRIRGILTDDVCPLGLAPEGQISYHSETLPRIEQGTARMGFWCAKDLATANRAEHMHILPISIHYRYDCRDLSKIVKAVAQLEKDCGLPTVAVAAPLSFDETLADLVQRLGPVEDRLFALAADYYAEISKKIVLKNELAADRWETLRHTATEVAEHWLGLPSRGDLTERMYRIRQVGWDRIYPPELPDHLSPLERALADRRAGEAWHAMRHMEFVDLMSYHDDQYLQTEPGLIPSFDRIVESVYNWQDLAARIMGGNIANRPNNIRKHAVLIPAPGLDLTERLPDYRQNARQAVQAATDELGSQYIACIKEYLHGKS